MTSRRTTTIDGVEYVLEREGLVRAHAARDGARAPAEETTTMTKITAFDRCADVGSIGVRLVPIDVGFDLRAECMAVRVPAGTTRASYADREGARYVVDGTTAEVVGVLRRAGYTIAD